MNICYAIYLISKILLTLLNKLSFLASDSQTLTSEGKVEFLFCLQVQGKKVKHNMIR